MDATVNNGQNYAVPDGAQDELIPNLQQQV
jgi:hypothetical protein